MVKSLTIHPAFSTQLPAFYRQADGNGMSVSCVNLRRGKNAPVELPLS